MGESDVELANLPHQNSLRSHEEYLGSLPPGYRFCPEDKELLGYYLLNKVMQIPLRPNRIWDINIYRYDPDKLTSKLKRLRESEWYFFSSRHRKYPKGSRPDRGTPGGFWKPTGANELICDGRGVLLGYKRTLDFYRGKQTDQSNSRSNWKMHEYVLPEVLPKTTGNSTAPSNNVDNMLLDHVILCKLYQKTNTKDVPNGTNLEGGTSNTRFETATNNVAGFSGGLHQESFPPTQYNTEASNQYHQSASLVFGHRVTSFSVETNTSHRLSVVSQAYFSQYGLGPSSFEGDHMSSLAPSDLYHQLAPLVSRVTSFATGANISDLPIEIYQESLPTTGPSNQYQQSAPLMSSLGGTSFATTTNYNISSLPSRLYQDQSRPPTQHYGLGPYNVEEPVPLLVDSDNINVNQLPSNLPLEPGAIDSTTLPVVYQLDEPALDDDAYFNQLSSQLQDPSCKWLYDSFVLNDLSKDSSTADGKNKL